MAISPAPSPTHSVAGQQSTLMQHVPTLPPAPDPVQGVASVVVSNAENCAREVNCQPDRSSLLSHWALISQQLLLIFCCVQIMCNLSVTSTNHCDRGTAETSWARARDGTRPTEVCVSKFWTAEAQLGEDPQRWETGPYCGRCTVGTQGLAVQTISPSSILFTGYTGIAGPFQRCCQHL